MKTLKISDVVKATNGKLLCGNIDAEITDITTDSRKVGCGMLFVPLVGEKFDGHNFLEEACKSGATAIITHKGEIPENAGDTVVIGVDNTLFALGKIAALYRSMFRAVSVAITGSVGKTTTKEMCALVLAKKYNIHKNKGNFNNEIGVPLTIFGLSDDDEILISEMGMSGFGEIDRISQMVNPSVVVMTNIGVSHIEFLGTQENIFKAKSEFMKNACEDIVVIINGDDDILVAHKEDLGKNVVTVGIENKDCDYIAENIAASSEEVSFTVKTKNGEKFDLTLPVPGEHNVYNALSAVALGELMKVGRDKLSEAFSEFVPDGMRMSVIETGDFRLINDCYNAAPDSMAAAINVLKRYDTRKVAVLGDIACLGELSKKAHTEVGEKVVQSGIDILITIGKEAAFIAASALENGMSDNNIHTFENVESALSDIRNILHKNDTVLIKASRVMELERVTQFLEKK